RRFTDRVLGDDFVARAHLVVPNPWRAVGTHEHADVVSMRAAGADRIDQFSVRLSCADSRWRRSVPGWLGRLVDGATPKYRISVGGIPTLGYEHVPRLVKPVRAIKR